jgi:hypothetical protein
MRHQNVRSRREFLSMLTASAGLGTALSLSSGLAQAMPVEPANVTVAPPTSSKGYQRTEHVDTYYRLADF